MKTTKKKKAIVLSLGLAAAMLSAMTANAQQDYDGSRGLFMRGPAVESNDRGGENFTVNTQTFGQEVPMGSGLVILLAVGAGYAALKRKEEKQ